MATPNNKSALTDEQKLKQVEREQGRQNLQQLLIELADERAAVRFTDKALDREHEKIMLVGGNEITRAQIREIELIIAKNLEEYEPQFPREFYAQIFRLKGWELPAGKIKEKPAIVAVYTNEVIYSRFTKEVLPMLQQLNPFVAWGVRQHKHFQFLNAEGKLKLQRYIDDAIKCMEEYNDWYTFRVNYARRHGLALQLDIWKEAN